MRIILLFLAVSAAAWTANWILGPPHGSWDTFDYTSIAYQYTGADPVSADHAALAFLDRWKGPDGPKDVSTGYASVIDAQTMEPARYRAIFETRPWYPLTGALLIPFIGPNGMIISAAVAGIALGVVMGLFVLGLTGSTAMALLAIGLTYALPTGHWATTISTEGWQLALWALALTLAILRPRWLLPFATIALLLNATRPNGVLLAITLVPLGFLVSSIRRPALIAAAASAGWIVLMAALGLPGMGESVQDLLTEHFTSPDVTSPWPALVELSLYRLPRMAGDIPPWLWLAAAVCGLALATRSQTWPWLLGAMSTVLLLVLHPVASEGPRFLAPVWLSASVAICMVLAPLWQRLVKGGSGLVEHGACERAE